MSDDLLMLAWVLLANAGGGDWDNEDAEWRAAAVDWRGKYHAYLDERYRPVGPGGGPAQ